MKRCKQHSHCMLPVQMFCGKRVMHNVRNGWDIARFLAEPTVQDMEGHHANLRYRVSHFQHVLSTTLQFWMQPRAWPSLHTRLSSHDCQQSHKYGRSGCCSTRHCTCLALCCVGCPNSVLSSQLNNHYTGHLTNLGLCRLLQEDRNYQPGWVWHMLKSRWGDEAVTAYSTAKAAEQQAAHQQASSALATQQHAAQQSALQQQARRRMAQQQRAQGWANKWMTPERALHYA